MEEKQLLLEKGQADFQLTTKNYKIAMDNILNVRYSTLQEQKIVQIPAVKHMNSELETFYK